MAETVEAVKIIAKKDPLEKGSLLSFVRALGRLEFVFRKTSFMLSQCADCRSSQTNANFLTINDQSLSLKVWLPDFRSVAHRVADVAAKLFAFSGDIAFV